MKIEILILTATEGEGKPLLDQAGPLEPVRRAVSTPFRGGLCGFPVRFWVAGMGPVNTAASLARELELDPPQIVLQVGIGGAYIPSRAAVGEVLIATEEIDGDLGVITPEGWQGAELIGIPVVPGDPPRYNRFPLDRELVTRAASATGARTGTFLTMSCCTGSSRVAEELWQRWGAVCESMEGAAAAHVCELYGVPFLEVRGVSNLVEDRNRDSWQIPRAVDAATTAALQIIANLKFEI